MAHRPRPYWAKVRSVRQDASFADRARQGYTASRQLAGANRLLSFTGQGSDTRWPRYSLKASDTSASPRGEIARS